MQPNGLKIDVPLRTVPEMRLLHVSERAARQQTLRLFHRRFLYPLCALNNPSLRERSVTGKSACQVGVLSDVGINFLNVYASGCGLI